MNGSDDQFYATAAQEVATKNVLPGLMARAFADSDGDEKKALARYIKARATQLRNEARASAAASARRQAKEQRRKHRQARRAPHPTSHIVRSCPACGTPYRPDDYRSDAVNWLCAQCHHELEKE